MPAIQGPLKGLSAAAVAAVLLAGATGCGRRAARFPRRPPLRRPLRCRSRHRRRRRRPALLPPRHPAPRPHPPPRRDLRAVGPADDAGRDAAPAPTRLAVAVDARGGRLALVRGGTPQEFTVTLRNGNSAEYRHVLVAFQMEFLVGEPGDQPGTGPGFLLERFDQAAGTWRATDFRIANDFKPPSMFTGGSPLAREAVRVERYRLRATAGGPTGSSPVVVSFIDTDADREVAAHVVLGHSTR
ncbi:hypothetical protein WKI68_01190 [Streptomyces sp. MS1.HAVA.3]|uniref:Lipoprotein n=1 Tax=Streptomyces caledonius TaxID=3134107 RepID=A0ABU8TXS2_9ACTN